MKHHGIDNIFKCLDNYQINKKSIWSENILDSVFQDSLRA